MGSSVADSGKDPFHHSQSPCVSWVPAMLGGPISHNPNLLTIRWLGTVNFELTYQGQVILGSAYFDPRGKGQLDIGITPDQVIRADVMFFGHEHGDHTKDGATIAKKTGAVMYGNQATINLFRSQGVPENQLKVVKSGDVYHFKGFTVKPFRMLHSSIGALSESYYGHTPEFWSTAYGAITPWSLGLIKQLQALEDNVPPPTIACPPNPPQPYPTIPLPGPEEYAYLFTFDNDFRFIFYDSLNWLILDEAKLFMQRIGGSVDVATSGFQGPGPQFAVPYALPAIKLFNPRYWFPGHHDPAAGNNHMPLLPMFYQIRKDMPGTEPIFLEYKQPLCFDVHKHIKLGCDRDDRD
jgi:hypothetical protein